MTETTKSYYAFDSLSSSKAALSEVGGKAQSLIDSLQAGFPVPPGFVLTVSFFGPWLQTVQTSSQWKSFLDDPSKETCDAIKAFCRRKLKLTSFQQKELDNAWRKVFSVNTNSNILVAVRSSSPEEDLVGNSFAGGYETTLGVKHDTLLAALIESFSSAFDYRIVQYKRKISVSIYTPKIAVIVQQQIASDAAGVAFSLNPSNNCYDEIVISANFGLGESVVGGIVTPDTYTVDVVTRKFAIWLEDSSHGTRREDNKDPSAAALTDEQILQVAQLVSKVENYRKGTPVDIEWVFQGKALYLLQSRPVTGYIRLFPEMVTARGEKKYLYLDIIVMSQGFSEPLLFSAWKFGRK